MALQRTKKQPLEQYSPFRELGNPFTVQSPEDMTVGDAISLFVDVFTDFPKVPREGHVFLHGPRGSGKSMMFRYLKPDCQCNVKKCTLEKLPFYAVWITLRNTNLNLTELRRLEDKHASTVLNEHFMTICFAEKVFSSVLEQNFDNSPADWFESTKTLMHDEFFRMLQGNGWAGNPATLGNPSTVPECFKLMEKVCNGLFTDVISYLKRLSFSTDVFPYDGPLCGYLDFLFPLLRNLKRLPFMPRGPIFLIIDDADNLNLTQTKILNSWVSTRTQAEVSLKISTQMTYKTYRTVTGRTIDTPHDYSEVNISTVYTASPKTRYFDRMKQIVSKRLNLFSITTAPEKFFPPDKEQETKIREIYKSYQAKWKQEGKGYRPEDDAYRYARPDFMKSLAGSSKSRYTYSYSGFEQLVHLSSGIIRYFLEPAALMYSETKSRNNKIQIEFIPPGIQNDVVRQQADNFLFNEFERLLRDTATLPEEVKKLDMLFNLINVLGSTFSEILLSDRSERRVFSVAFYENPSKKLQEILNLGVQNGYFHVSAIGNKEGTGRTRLYVLSRRLAPYFYLDPTSFAGYLFVNEEQIWEAMHTPDKVLRRIKKDGLESVFEQRQLKLFE